MKAEQTANTAKNKVIQKKTETKGNTLPAESSLKLPGISLLNGVFGETENTSSPQFGVKQLQSAPSISPTQFSNMPIQRVGVELRGAQTLGAKFNSFFLGKESTYTLLQKKYKEYLKGNTELKGECINLANKWLKDHGKSKDPNDKIKHQSINELLKSFTNNNVNEINEPEYLPLPNPSPNPVPDIITTDEPEEINKSNIEKIKILHDEYAELKKETTSVNELYSLFNKLANFVQELKKWDLNFANFTNPDFETESLMISDFRKILLDSFVYNSDIISGTISDLNEEKLLNGIFSASSMSAIIKLSSGNIGLIINEIKINQSGFEFDEASIDYNNTIGFADIFSITEPVLKVSSKATGFEITASGNLAANLGDNFEVYGDVEIAYNTDSKAFEKPKISSGGFKYKSKLDFGGVIGVENVNGKISIEDKKYSIGGSGDLSIIIPGTSSAKGTVVVDYNKTVGFKINKITNGEFDAGVFNDLINLKAKGISYDKEGLKIDTGSLILSFGNYIPGADGIEANAKNLSYINGAFDWDTVSFKIDKNYTFGGFNFILGDAKLNGKSKKYLIEIVKSGAKVSIGPWFNAEGGATFDWDVLHGKMPDITSSTLNFLASSPIIPRDIIPGILPIDYSIQFPFFAGPVPMEAGISLSVDASAKVDIGGKMNYANNEYEFEVDSTGKGGLKMGVGANISVGNSLIISIGAFIQGMTEAELLAGLSLDGKATKNEFGFDFSDINLNYRLGANIKAQINAGIEARALLIFRKTLYKIKIKEWDMGHAEKTGAVNLLSNKKTDEGNSEGVFKIGNIPLKKPDAEAQTLPFVHKMEAIDKVIKRVTSIPEGEMSVDGLLAAKKEVLDLLQQSIDITVEDNRFIKIIKRLDHYVEKMANIERQYLSWTLRQEIKKQEPDKFADKFKVRHWRKSREEYYTAKLAVGVIKHQQYVKRNQDKKDHVQRQFNVYNSQILQAERMMIDIDKLLDPLNEVEDISAEISKKETLDRTLDDLKFQIEIDEAAELAQERLEDSYLSILMSDEDHDKDLQE